MIKEDIGVVMVGFNSGIGVVIGGIEAITGILRW